MDTLAHKDFLQNLRDDVRSLRPTPASRHCRIRTHVPDDILKAEYVFVRHDAHRTPLSCVYDGLYRVLKNGSKTFVIDVGGRRDTVTIDRLKRAYTDPAVPTIVAKPPSRGRPRKARSN